jgi:Integrase core domain
LRTQSATITITRAVTVAGGVFAPGHLGELTQYLPFELVERLHQTLQRELLNVHGPFASIEALQAALDAWRQQYNTDRPHQSLAMAFPASRFTPASSALELRIPAQLTAGTGQPKPPPPDAGSPPAASLPEETAPLLTSAATLDGQPAVEVDRVVPASGNLC